MTKTVYVVTDVEYKDGKLPWYVKQKLDQGYRIVEVREERTPRVGRRWIWVLKKDEDSGQASG